MGRRVPRAGSEHRNPCSAAAGLHRFILAAGKPVFPIPASEAPERGQETGATILLLAGGLWSQRFGEAEGRKERQSALIRTAHGAVTHVPPAALCRQGLWRAGCPWPVSEPGRQGRKGSPRGGFRGEAGLERPCLPHNSEDWLAGWRSSGWSVRLWALQQHQLPPAHRA